MKFFGAKITFLTCIIMAVSFYIAFVRRSAETPVNLTQSIFNESGYRYRMGDSVNTNLSFSENVSQSYSLHYDFYRESCPLAEWFIGKFVRDPYASRPSIAPSLTRLLFHDCFIGGCDASVLLDADEAFTSKKEAIPNLSLKGFDVIDAIKLKLEMVCPGVVSCADILVLAAREAVLVAGGPLYQLKTGRKDAENPFKEAAQRQLPSPLASLPEILAIFASRGFSERETVSLFGAHSIGITHCTFFKDRLYNFSGTGKPDPELNPGFLQELKTKCPFSASASSVSPSPGTGLTPSLPAPSVYSNNYDMSSGNRYDGVVDLSFNSEGGEINFGTRYYRRLMQKKGLLFSDQQLTSREETEKWVRAYASAPLLFRRDFAMSMMKLSSYRVLTGPLGQVRTKCSKVLPRNKN